MLQFYHVQPKQMDLWLNEEILLLLLLAAKISVFSENFLWIWINNLKVLFAGLAIDMGHSGWKQLCQVTGLKLNCQIISFWVVRWLCSVLFQWRSQVDRCLLSALSVPLWYVSSPFCLWSLAQSGPEMPNGLSHNRQNTHTSDPISSTGWNPLQPFRRPPTLRPGCDASRHSLFSDTLLTRMERIMALCATLTVIGLIVRHLLTVFAQSKWILVMACCHACSGNIKCKCQLYRICSRSTKTLRKEGLFSLFYPAPHPELLLLDSRVSSRRYPSGRLLHHCTSFSTSVLFPTLPTWQSQCGDFLTFTSTSCPLVYAPVRLPKKLIN